MSQLNRRRPPKKFWIRTTALTTLVCFSAATAGWSQDIAGGDRSSLPSLPLNALPPLSAAISIPSGLGEVQQFHQGTGPVVIMIQDAHVNETAQKNIAAILKYLRKEHPLTLVMLEGAEGRLFPELFNTLPSKAARREIAGYLLGEGRLTGPGYFSIVDKPELSLVGIEDPVLYEKNRQAYLQAAEGASRNAPRLRELRKILETVSRHVYSADLQDLYDAKRHFENARGGGFAALIRTLSRFSEKTGISLEDYPAVERMARFSELESRIIFEKLPREFRAFTADLRLGLEERGLAELKKETAAYKAGKIKKSDYYHQLETRAQRAGPSFNPKRHKNILRYLRLVQLSEKLDASLFDEMESLETRIKSGLFSNEEERRLDHLWKVFETSSKMLSFSLTSRDAHFFYENREDFKADVFESFLRPILEKYHFQNSYPAGFKAFEEAVENAERFYQAALERDGALAQRALAEMKASQASVAALVAGGFHTPGIEAELKKRNCSYLIVTPRMSGAGDSRQEKKLYDEALREKPLAGETDFFQNLAREKNAVSQDPLFQLAAFDLVPTEQKGREVLAGLRGGFPALQEGPQRAHSGVTALAVFSALLMHVNELFKARGNKALVKQRWDKKINALQRAGKDSAGFETLRDLILRGQFWDGPEAKLFIFPAEMSVQDSRVLALKYPTGLRSGEILSLFPGLGAKEIRTVNTGPSKILMMTVPSEDLALIQNRFQQMSARQRGLQVNRSEVRGSPLPRRDFLKEAGAGLAGLFLGSYVSSARSADLQRGLPDLQEGAPLEGYFDLARQAFDVQIPTGPFAGEVTAASEVILPEYEIRAPSQEEILDHLKQMLTRGAYNAEKMDPDLKKRVDARAVKYYAMIHERSGELADILDMNDPKIPKTFFTNMIVEWLVRRDIFHYRFRNVPEPLPHLLDAIILSAKETAEWLDFERSFVNHSLNGTYISLKYSKIPRTDSVEEFSFAGYKMRPVELYHVRNIRDNNEVPEIFRSQIGGKVQDWTALEKIWQKRVLGQKLGVNLSTFMGVSQALAVTKFNFTMDKLTEQDSFASLSVDPDRRWSAPANFFTMLYLILNRKDELKDNFPALRMRNTLLNTLSSAEAGHFFYLMLNKTDHALTGAQNKTELLFMGPQDPKEKPALYPYLQLPRRVYRTHFVDAGDIAKAFVYSTVYPSAEIQQEVMKRAGSDGADILNGDAAEIASQVMMEVMNDKSRSFQRLYQFHNDPVARRIYEAVMRGEFSPEVGKKSRQVTLKDLKSIDLRFVSPDEASLIYYLIGLHESRLPFLSKEFIDRWVNIDFIRALIGKDAARAATWVRIGFENGYVRVKYLGEKNGKRQYDVDSSELMKLFQDIDRILVFIELFMGKRLNLSNPDDIGTAVSMVENARKMGLKPEQFSMLLLLGADRAGIDRVIHDYETNPNDNDPVLANPRIAQVKAMKKELEQDPSLKFEMQRDLAQLLSELTGDPQYAKKGFSFSDRLSGSDQIGFVLSFVMMRVKEGWAGTHDHVQQLTATVRTVGMPRLLRASRVPYQAFEAAFGKPKAVVSDQFFEMSPGERGRLMAVLQEMAFASPASRRTPVRRAAFAKSEVRQQGAAVVSADASRRLQKAVGAVQKMTFQQRLNRILNDGEIFEQFNASFPAYLVQELERRGELRPLKAQAASSASQGVILAPWIGIETVEDLVTALRPLPSGTAKIIFSVPPAQLKAAKALRAQVPGLNARVTLSSASLENLAADFTKRLGISLETRAVRLSTPPEAVRQNPRLAVPILGVGAELLKRSYDLIIISPHGVPGVTAIDVSMTFLEEMIDQWQNEIASAQAAGQSA